MNEVESVRPAGGNILDLWDKIMEPFEPEKEASDIGEKDNTDKEGEDNEETLSLGEEEGIVVKVGRMRTRRRRMRWQNTWSITSHFDHGVVFV